MLSLSRPLSSTRKIQCRKNGHGKKILYVNLPEEETLSLIGDKGTEVEITPDGKGNLTIRKVVVKNDN